jgi:transcriptional regulator with XRE-family HTH domain
MTNDLTPTAASAALEKFRAGKLTSKLPRREVSLAENKGFPMTDNVEPIRSSGDQLALFSPSPAPLPLNAYLACALTGLTEVERSNIFRISDIISNVCNENGIVLYQPRHATDPKLHVGVSASAVYEQDKGHVLESDVIIHLGHHPSTGAGEELEFARSALLPIILVYPDTTKISRMILGIPSLIIQIAYKNIDDLVVQFTHSLLTFRTVFEERKLAFSSYRVNLIGEKIRQIRQNAQLTRKQIAEASGKFTEDRLTAIEELSDLDSNPSLLELREIATILKTTVSEIVEPNLAQQLFAALKNWTEGREAARTFISADDQRRILKSMMYRMADWL